MTTAVAPRKINIKRFGGMNFYLRPGSSDEKTVKEVITNHAYMRKDFRIEGGEKWLDLGGNIGAFTVGAARVGADVTVYEPDPSNVEILQMNLRANGCKANVIQKAVVHDDRASATLNLWPQGQSWRNSIVRNRRGTVPVEVGCANFFNIATPDTCVKMDIEGAEIEILEHWPAGFTVKKLVFEYSFDVDPNVYRLRLILEKLKSCFASLHYSKQIETLDRWDFFPPATMVFCTKPRYLTGA